MPQERPPGMVTACAFQSDQARPRIRLSPISRLRSMPARSRRERRSGASGPPSTTGCCRSRRNSAPQLPILAAGSRSRPRPPVTADQADLERPPHAAASSSEAIIGNAHELLDHGLTELRQVVLDIAEAGLRAAHPGRAVERLGRYDGRMLEAGGGPLFLAGGRSNRGPRWGEAAG